MAQHSRARVEVDNAQSHIRGSSLLLVGRVTALVATLVTQVIIVRYLTKADYGAFAFALALVTLLQPLLTLGLDRADTRFLARDDEQDRPESVLGLILLEAAIIVGLGLVVAVAALASRSLLEVWLSGPQAVSLLLILIALAPAQALDGLVMNVFALFAGARAVFVRRFLLAPGLRMLVALVLVLAERPVTFLAWGYLVTAVAGTAIYIALLRGLLAERGVLPPHNGLPPRLPVREALSFSAPLLTTNLVTVVTSSLGVVALGYLADSTEVAAFRAVQPIAALNVLVMTSFDVLFVPAASRLAARDDRVGLSNLYWRSAAWIAVLTFPIAAVTVCFADSVVLTLFGERYSSSAPYLAVLSLATYLQAASGFNGLTLQVLGRLRYILVTNLLMVVLGVAANIILVAAYGAWGAVTAAALVFVVHNVVKQAGLARGTGIPVLNGGFARLFFLLVAPGLVGLAALQAVASLSLPVAFVVVAAVTLVLVRVSRHQLEVLVTFPELTRVPLLGWFLR